MEKKNTISQRTFDKNMLMMLDVQQLIEKSSHTNGFVWFDLLVSLPASFI